MTSPIVLTCMMLSASAAAAQPIRVFVKPIDVAVVIDIDAARRATQRAQLIAALKRDKVALAERLEDADVLVEILPLAAPPPDPETKIGWMPFVGFYKQGQPQAPIDVAIMVGEHREEIRAVQSENPPRHTSRRIRAFIVNNQRMLLARRPQ
jgi:hypothetical protein